MPIRPYKPCHAHNCGKLTMSRYCEQHTVEQPQQRSYNRARGTAHSRGYDLAWTKIREQALKRDRHLCRICLTANRAVPATEVHHTYPVQTHPEHRLNLDILLSVCHSHHLELEAYIRAHGVEPPATVIERYETQYPNLPQSCYA